MRKLSFIHKNNPMGNPMAFKTQTPLLHEQ